MNIQRIIPVFALSSLTCALAVLAPATAEAYTYFCDAPRYYPANDCQGSDMSLDDRAGEIIQELRSDGWTGEWWEGEQAWSSDFIESSSVGVYRNGHDGEWGADLANFAMFLGHGNNATLHFGYPDPFSSRCDAGGTTNPNGFGMGLRDGAEAAIVMYATCCTMNPNYLSYMAANNGATQMFGFGSVSNWDSGMVHEFYEDTQDTPNVTSWLDRMEDKPGWGTGDNSTVALVAGDTADQAASLAGYCALRQGKCNDNMFANDSSHWYWYWWRDHGTCP